MNDRKGILAAGNWLVDHLKIIDAWPSQDALVNIRTESRGTGGAPFNVLIDLAKLGADFPLAGAGVVGQDEPGDWIFETCRIFGVDTSLIRRTDQEPTSYSDVMTVEQTGRRTFFHRRGANTLLDADCIPLEASNAKIFHLGYLLLLDRLDQPCKGSTTGTAEVFRKASELGFLTSADVVSEESDRFARVVLPTLPFLDIIFLNEFEAARVVSLEIRRGNEIDVATLLKTAEAILAAGVRRWVIIHFPEGVLAASRDGRRIFQPSVLVPPNQIVGSVGAGDALAAGLLLGYHNEVPMEECLVFGVCAAAASLRHASTTGGVERLDACLALGHAFDYRESIL